MIDSNIMEDEQFRDYGICPVCQKGHLYAGTQGYTCDYFKTNEDKCHFTILYDYYSHRITEEDIKQLCENKQTEVIDNFVKKDGTPFASMARLIIEETSVKLSFLPRSLPVPCPKCGGKIEIQLKGYACENYSNASNDIENRCLYIPKVFCGVELTETELIHLFKDRKTSFLEGFKNKDGKIFDSRLVMTDEFNLVFDSVLCPCPKCGGNIFSGSKAYNCSNFKNEQIKCGFTVWKEIAYRSIHPSEVIELCQNGETKLLYGFTSKSKEKYFDGKLKLDDNMKVIVSQD